MVLEPQPQLVALTIVLYIGNDREGCPLHVEQAKWLVILQKCTLCTLKHSKINDTLALIIIYFTAFGHRLSLSLVWFYYYIITGEFPRAVSLIRQTTTVRPPMMGQRARQRLHISGMTDGTAVNVQ